MNANETKETIRILQQNVNASPTAQAETINNHHNNSIDIIALQEPYFDFKGTSRASREWISIYPKNTGKEGTPKVRSMILVSSKIKSDSWEEIPTKSNDLTIIRINIMTGWLYICNIYLESDSDEAIEELRWICQEKESDESAFIWMGDFNRHHPMWDDPTHTHLFSASNLRKAENLINIVTSLGMTMALRKKTPTLEHFRSKRLSRPDNVFMTEDMKDKLSQCEVFPELKPSKTDHFPVITTIHVDKTTTIDPERRNWKKVDWKELRQNLEKELGDRPTRPLKSKREARTLLDRVYKAIDDSVEKFVPRIKPSKYQRRWWNKEIENLIEQEIDPKISLQTQEPTGAPDTPGGQEHQKQGRRGNRNSKTQKMDGIPRQHKRQNSIHGQQDGTKRTNGRHTSQDSHFEDR